MKKFVVCFVAALLSLPLMAQENAPKAEVFGGYQYLHLGSDTSFGSTGGGQGFNGWNVAAQANFSKYAGIEGDFSGAYAKVSGVSTHVYTYAGGPVVFAQLDRIKPFAHVLFGGTKIGASESGVSISLGGYTVMAGGGVDAKVNRALAVRVAQVDWLYYHFGSKTISGVQIPAFSGSNNVRISTGVVLRF
jgi:hypothetical protein